MPLINDKDKKLGTVRHTVKVKTRYWRKTPQRTLNVTFNFAGVSIGKLIEWATRHLIVKFQHRMRLLPTEEAFDAFHEVGPDVEIFALDAEKPITRHLSKEDLINHLKEDEEDEKS